jgi:hypothetical protein
MNCKSVKNHLPRYIDYDLPDDVLKEIGLHLVDCETCQSELRAYEESRNVLRQLGDQPMTAPAIESLQRSIRHKVQRRAMRSAANRALQRTSWNPRGIWGITLAAAMLILVMSAGFLVYLERYWAHVEQGEGNAVAVEERNPEDARPVDGDGSEGIEPVLDKLSKEAATALETELDEVLYPIESVHEAWQYDFPGVLKSLELPAGTEPAPRPDGEWERHVRATLVRF